MKNVMKATKLIAKILEVIHWIAAGVMAITVVCAFAAPQWLTFVLDPAADRPGIAAVYGFETTITDAVGNLSIKALFLAAVGAALIYALMAMVFRNIYLIIKRSETGSPFQKDNVRMVREIGIFSIAIPVVGLLMSVIIRLAMGPDAVETSVKLSGFITGIVVLSLSQLFAYGASLEKDVDGLL